MTWLERNQGARQLKSDGVHEKDKGNEDRIKTFFEHILQ
jgi:hypothetical protein